MEAFVRVVQCPKCGSPVQGVSAGDIATCSYCGATLQVSAGASGHPIAKLANIEASTSYLARTEALKRLRGQLDNAESDLETLEYSRATALMAAGGAWAVAGLAAGVVWLGVWASRDAGLAVAGLLGLPVLVGLSTRLLARRSVAARFDIEVASARAERDRLAQRIAQLEAGLDDLADQL